MTNRIRMSLDDRLSFREALLEQRTEEEWKLYRPHYTVLYGGKFILEGKEVTGRELIAEYANRFPADREYSDKGEWNRMLTECAVSQFSFTDPEVMRGFLFSARSPAQWKRYQPSGYTFESLDFQYMGINIKGKMLLYNLFVELENQKNGTFYAYIDYAPERNAEMNKKLRATENGAFIKRAFDIAGLTIKWKSIFDENLTSEKLRDILLTKRKEEEWRRWEGNSSDFEHTWFDSDGYRNFTGGALRRRYGELRQRKYSAKDIFSEAGIEVGSDLAILRQRVEDRFEKLYGMLDDPQAVREFFLQLKSEEEWGKPQRFTELRPKRISVNGDRNITIHALLHLFSLYKHNLQQDFVENYIGMEAAENSGKHHPGLFQSNQTALEELLNFAGIETRFVPDVTDVDLHDPDLLRRMLFHGTYNNRSLSVIDLNSTAAYKLRKAKFTDPKTGLELTGHSLMLYYSAFFYLKEHPEVGLNEATNGLNKGKSNQAVMDEILQKAGLKKTV